MLRACVVPTLSVSAVLMDEAAVSVKRPVPPVAMVAAAGTAVTGRPPERARGRDGDRGAGFRRTALRSGGDDAEVVDDLARRGAVERDALERGADTEVGVADGYGAAAQIERAGGAEHGRGARVNGGCGP